ncbi:MAG TPA: hypothetical protein VFK80_08195 [Limnochordia bacterium]|nr:hypothetical protein [Limnochordia bacterium]
MATARARASNNTQLIGLGVIVLIIFSLITILSSDHQSQAVTPLGKVLAVKFDTAASITQAVVADDGTLQVTADWLGLEIDQPTDQAGWTKLAQSLSDQVRHSENKWPVHLVLSYRGETKAEAASK